MAIARSRPGLARDQRLVGGVVAAAWALTLAAAISGSRFLDHDALLADDARPRLLTLLAFLAAWQLMTAAMMLPSSLPMIRLFSQISRNQTRPHLVVFAFVAAYFVVWSGFALVALAGDAGLHALVERWRWLEDRPNLIAGAVLLVAGAFQFSPLKERCLRECRSPQGFLWRHYARGVAPAWSLGFRHGLFCLGCCWALMLTMFALGVGSLALMLLMTVVMLAEKTARRGARLVPIVGTALVLVGALLVV